MRRAIRYGYSYLGFTEPFMTKLVPILAEQFDGVFPELIAQQDFVATVIREEEISFLRTLESGLKRLDYYLNDPADNLEVIAKIVKVSDLDSNDESSLMEPLANHRIKFIIPGRVVFELYNNTVPKTAENFRARRKA